MSLPGEAKETAEVPEKKTATVVDLKKIREEMMKKKDDEKKKKEIEIEKETDEKKTDDMMVGEEKKDDEEVGPAPKKFRPYVSKLVAGGKLHKVVIFCCICFAEELGLRGGVQIRLGLTWLDFLIIYLDMFKLNSCMSCFSLVV